MCCMHHTRRTHTHAYMNAWESFTDFLRIHMTIDERKIRAKLLHFVYNKNNSVWFHTHTTNWHNQNHFCHSNEFYLFMYFRKIYKYICTFTYSWNTPMIDGVHTCMENWKCGLKKMTNIKEFFPCYLFRCLNPLTFRASIKL